MNYLIGIGLGLSLLAVVLYVLEVIANWRIFSKAGEAGWKSLIPVYNEYILFKISWKTAVFWAMLALAFVIYIFDNNTSTYAVVIKTVIGIVLAVIEIIAYNKLAKSFGKGIGFTVGLVFLTPIFLLILGLGDAQYIGNASDM